MKPPLGRQQFHSVDIGQTLHMNDKVYEKIDGRAAAQIARNDDGLLEPLTAIHVIADTWVYVIGAPSE